MDLFNTIDLNNSTICKNGHYLKHFTHKYCPSCGAETINSCTNCGNQIPFLNATSLVKNYNVPSYCQFCGKPYPWTQSIIDTATEIVKEDELLTEEQTQQLCSCFPDLLSSTPKTQLALIRYKKIVDKALSTTSSALKDILIDIVSEAVKIALWYD